ncbi:hypothetical protein BOX15_Mlig014457g5, partial [Macrostomum lignano]
ANAKRKRRSAQASEVESSADASRIEPNLNAVSASTDATGSSLVAELASAIPPAQQQPPAGFSQTVSQLPSGATESHSSESANAKRKRRSAQASEVESSADASRIEPNLNAVSASTDATGSSLVAELASAIQPAQQQPPAGFSQTVNQPQGCREIDQFLCAPVAYCSEDANFAILKPVSNPKSCCEPHFGALAFAADDSDPYHLESNTGTDCSAGAVVGCSNYENLAADNSNFYPQMNALSVVQDFSAHSMPSQLVDFVTAKAEDGDQVTFSANVNVSSARIEEESVSVTLPVSLKPEDDAGCSVVLQKLVSSTTKLHYCKYCGKMLTKISRHYKTAHKAESDVKRLQQIRRKSIRRKAFKALESEGDYIHNKMVLAKREGELIIARRQKDDENSPGSFLPCHRCFQFIKKDLLYRHRNACSGSLSEIIKEDENDSDEDTENSSPSESESAEARLKNPTNNHYVQLSRILLKNPEPASKLLEPDSELFKTVLSRLICDDLFDTICKDELLLRLGDRYLSKQKKVNRQHVSSKIRDAARVFIQLQQLHGDYSLRHFLQPQYFDDWIEVIRKLSNEAPTFALRMGHSIPHLCNILIGEAIRTSNDGLKKSASDFLELKNTEYHHLVTAKSLKTISERAALVQDCVPLTDDIVKLSTFMKSAIVDKIEELKTGTLDSNVPLLYRELVYLIMTKLTFFNRRRSSEISQMVMAMLDAASASHTQDDLHQYLTPLEKELASRLKVINISGKRGRSVPIVIDRICWDGLMCLKDCREAAGVSRKNVFVFAIPGYEQSVYRCPVAIDKVVKMSSLQLQRADLLRSRFLRKHCATVSQLLDLKDNELDWLARHLGHDITVHRQFYRLHQNTLELAKVSKILELMESGNLKKFKGKGLEEITLEDLSEPPLDDHDETAELSAVPDTSATTAASTSATTAASTSATTVVSTSPTFALGTGSAATTKTSAKRRTKSAKKLTDSQ